MILTDRGIRERVYNPFDPMIANFSEGVSGDKIISYGLTSAGYDMRLSTEIWIFKNTLGVTVDPKQFKDEEYLRQCFDKIETPRPFIISPGGYVLGKSFERFHIPSDIKATTMGKSTYARAGIIINTTPAEPGWRGYLTIEIGNLNPCPVRVYPMEGIAQMEFHLLDSLGVETDYAKKGGKYQDQVGVTPPIVR